MLKIFVVLSLLFLSAFSTQTDKEILQDGLNGLFEENNLPDPITIMPCIDDDTAHKIVEFLGVLLEKAAKGSAKDLISLIPEMKKFDDSIPKDVKKCLDGNAEFEALGQKYGLDDSTDSKEVEKKFITYITLHYLSVHKWLGSLNDNWKKGNPKQVGHDAGSYLHNILGTKADEEPNLTDKQIIQQVFNGLFEQNKLLDPVTIVPCFDDATAHKVVEFAGQLLAKAAKGSAKDLLDLIQLMKKFGDEIPEPVKHCLSINLELKVLGIKYGIDNTTDPSYVEKKVVTYITLHYLTVHKWIVGLNEDWIAGNYKKVGFDVGTYGHNVLKTAVEEEEPNLTDKQILQQVFNGLFEQNRMPDPITVMICIDDATAHKIVEFTGQVLAKAAKGSAKDLLDLIPLIKKFGDEIPDPVKHCLSINLELKALGIKYGIDESTDPSYVEKKVIAYITLHYLTVHKWIGNLNENWIAANYKQVGFDAATYGHNILKLTPEDVQRLAYL